MNEFMWACIIEQFLRDLDETHFSRVVVHSTHRNILTFELRSIRKKVVAFGRVQLKSEYCVQAVEAEVFWAYQRLQEKLK